MSAEYRGLALPVMIFTLAAALFAASFWRDRGGDEEETLVVYCAHDSVFSQQILREFERRTGIAVQVRFDEEATKSLGLVNQLIAEKDNPRCDVFWNNQLFNTLRLKDAGVLEPYESPEAERIPAAYRDPDGYWTGFAARLRVYIVNTERMSCTVDAIRERLAGSLLGVAIAKPLFGTTRSHYAVLWDALGKDFVRDWHRGMRERGVREVPGNSAVRNLVADGVCVLGLTDTDDFFGALDDGQPVEMLPVRVKDKFTICIPNTVAVIRGARHRSAACKLVDFLLSEEVELALAQSRARQIPLGPVDESALPEEVRQLREWAADAYPLQQAAAVQQDCLDWLQSEYLR